jgi:pyrimidine operon attenuation protein/uracil phosphoribosyltransferase
MKERVLLEKKQLMLTIDRLCHQLIEKHGNFKNVAIIGMQPRGVFFSRRILSRLNELTGLNQIQYGELDIAFYRDDYRRGNEQITPSQIKINFSTSNQTVVLIDDVLFTGRSIRAALDAITDFGRPSKVELMVLVDRQNSRDLPIQADYTGIVVDSRSNDKVKVEWKESHKKDTVYILPND